MEGVNEPGFHSFGVVLGPQNDASFDLGHEQEKVLPEITLESHVIPLTRKSKIGNP